MDTSFIFLIICLIASVENKDKEKIPDDPDLVEYAHDDPHSVDHASLHSSLFIGTGKPSEAFEHLNDEERKAKLSKIFDEMDEDHDNLVDHSELKNWILKSLRNIDQETAQVTLRNDDVNGDGKVSWPEVLQSRHEFTEKEFEEFSKQKLNDSEIHGTVDQIEEERKTFLAADSNKDGLLDTYEYAAFTSPWKYGHMLWLEVDDMIKKVDTNKDKVIDFQEYSKYRKATPEQKVRYEDVKRKFQKLDTDKNGKLSHAELLHAKEIPLERSAERETKHVMSEIDKDGNSLLTKDEVMARLNYMLSGAHEHHQSRHDEL